MQPPTSPAPSARSSVALTSDLDYYQACYERLSSQSKTKVQQLARELGLPVGNRLKDTLCRDLARVLDQERIEEARAAARTYSLFPLYRHNESAVLVEALQRYRAALNRFKWILSNTRRVLLADPDAYFVYLEMTMACPAKHVSFNEKNVVFKLFLDARERFSYTIHTVNEAIDDVLHWIPHIVQRPVTGPGSYASPGEVRSPSSISQEDAIEAVASVLGNKHCTQLVGLRYCYILRGRTFFKGREHPHFNKSASTCQDVLGDFCKYLGSGDVQGYERLQRTLQNKVLGQVQSEEMDSLILRRPLFPALVSPQDIRNTQREKEQRDQLLAEVNAERAQAGWPPYPRVSDFLANEIYEVVYLTPSIGEEIANRDAQLAQPRGLAYYDNLYRQGRYEDFLRALLPLFQSS